MPSAELDIDLNDLGETGAVADMPSHLLPPEVMTDLHLMKVVDGCIERRGGQTQVFGTPTVAPHFAIMVRSPALAEFLVYTDLDDAYVYNGTTHTRM